MKAQNTTAPLFSPGMVASLRTLADVFHVDRRTAAKRVKAASIEPAGSYLGHPVYPVGPAAVAVLSIVDEDGNQNPSTMKPMDRRAHWQAENERVRFEQSIGQLLHVDDVREQLSMMVKTCTRALDTLPDRAERDRRCPPDLVQWLEDEARKLRDELHATLSCGD